MEKTTIENQRKAILAKTHNVTDNYCKVFLDYFKITINSEIRKPFFTCFRIYPAKGGSPAGVVYNMKICIWITKILIGRNQESGFPVGKRAGESRHEVTIMTYEDRFREDRYHVSFK